MQHSATERRLCVESREWEPSPWGRFCFLQFIRLWSATKGATANSDQCGWDLVRSPHVMCQWTQWTQWTREMFSVYTCFLPWPHRWERWPAPAQKISSTTASDWLRLIDCWIDCVLLLQICSALHASRSIDVHLWIRALWRICWGLNGIHTLSFQPHLQQHSHASETFASTEKVTRQRSNGRVEMCLGYDEQATVLWNIL